MVGCLPPGCWLAEASVSSVRVGAPSLAASLDFTLADNPSVNISSYMDTLFFTESDSEHGETLMF